VGRFYQAVGRFGPELWAVLVHWPFLVISHKKQLHVFSTKLPTIADFSKGVYV